MTTRGYREEVISFDARDKRGRVCGVRVATWIVSRTRRTVEGRFTREETFPVFYLSTYSTRDGRDVIGTRSVCGYYTEEARERVRTQEIDRARRNAERTNRRAILARAREVGPNTYTARVYRADGALHTSRTVVCADSPAAISLWASAHTRYLGAGATCDVLRHAPELAQPGDVACGEVVFSRRCVAGVHVHGNRLQKCHAREVGRVAEVPNA